MGTGSVGLFMVNCAPSRKWPSRRWPSTTTGSFARLRVRARRSWVVPYRPTPYLDVDSGTPCAPLRSMAQGGGPVSWHRETKRDRSMAWSNAPTDAKTRHRNAAQPGALRGSWSFFQGYGLVIVDECHHVPAVTFESLLKACPIRRIVG